MNKRIQLVIVGILACVLAKAQDVIQTGVDDGHTYIEKRYTIFFPIAKAEVVNDYMDNGRTLQTMLNDLNETIQAAGTIPDSMTIFASTSPEGPVALNERLAIQRANNTKAILLDMLPQITEENIKVTSRANDWSGMILTLRRDTTLAYRDELLRVLTDPTITNKDKYIRTQMPEPYAAIRDNMFDNMRTSSVTISVIKTSDNMDEYVVEPELYITSASPMEFTKDGGAGNVAFQKTVSDHVIPAATCDAGWVEDLTPTETGIDFKVAPNLMAEARSAAIKIECYEKLHEVIVNQAPADPVMTLTSASPMEFAAEGGEGMITFEKNSDDDIVPLITPDARWVDVVSSDQHQTCIVVSENKTEKTRSTSVIVECYGDEHEVIINQAAAVKEPKPFYMTAKTNMLYDLALVPNIGLEFYLGKNFSLAGNWMYSWWKNDPKALYWRTYGGDLALKYWFGRASKEKPLTGHHIGLYGQIVTYDFELGKRGYLGDRWSYGGGVEYGYSVPVARRLNIDFNLGVGYLGGEFEEYLPIDGHYVWQATKHRHWFGPTKLEVSLTWLLGKGNINKGKGGKR